MNTSSKRIKLDPSPPSPSEDEQDRVDVDDIEQEHCTICLQPFLDRTIIPVCAHEFCFECILLWSEQSRKCPLCSRSFLDSYLIHHFRSQYDYQKHYLPPLRSSSPQPLTHERATALRNARRMRQWGRRQRRQREEADQLERAITRRRWIYQHHLYAKHVASNPYTRYRPFPTPAQFSASPDLVSRMMIFLRRELHVWPNLDVEFLTTYTISLMKSIDIRSESAVKLLSEFLDLDTPYAAGARHVNAEHFAHEIYSYLRSPYRDLNMYDQMAQYDTPPEIPPPLEIERGDRWNVEWSPYRPSRSRSNSRSPSPALRRENSLDMDHDRVSSAEARSEGRSDYRHDSDGPPRGPEHHDFRNHPSGRIHSPLNGVHSRDGHSGEVPCPEATDSAFLAKHEDSDFPVQGDDAKVKSGTMEAMEDDVAAVDTPRGDYSIAPADKEPSVIDIDEPFQKAGDVATDYVDEVGDEDSSANPQPSRKRSAGSTRPSVHARPRNRTLSESVQAYLARPVAPWHPKRTKTLVSIPARAAEGDAHPRNGTSGSAMMGEPAPSRETTNGPCMSDGDAVHERINSDRAGSGNENKTAAMSLGRVDTETRGGFLSLVDEHAGERGQMNMDTSSSGNIAATSGNDGDACSSRTENGHSVSLPVSGSKSRSRFESEPGSGSGSGSDSGPLPTWTSAPPDLNLEHIDVCVGVKKGVGGDVDMDMPTLEKRLRARAHVRMRLAAIKGVVSGVGHAPSSGSG